MEVNDNAISQSSLQLNDDMEEVRTHVMFNLSPPFSTEFKTKMNLFT